MPLRCCGCINCCSCELSSRNIALQQQVEELEKKLSRAGKRCESLQRREDNDKIYLEWVEQQLATWSRLATENASRSQEKRIELENLRNQHVNLQREYNTAKVRMTKKAAELQSEYKMRTIEYNAQCHRVEALETVVRDYRLLLGLGEFVFPSTLRLISLQDAAAENNLAMKTCLACELTRTESKKRLARAEKLQQKAQDVAAHNSQITEKHAKELAEMREERDSARAQTRFAWKAAEDLAKDVASRAQHMDPDEGQEDAARC